MAERELPTTRIALLELADERRSTREGYDLLDEKRMLLAARMLRLIEAVEARRAAHALRYGRALDALRVALDRHGLHELELLPVPEVAFGTTLTRERVLGVELVTALEAVEVGPATPASPEAQLCAEAWRGLLQNRVALAALECSLWRLSDEYARTERRASAIEQVLLPELERGIATIESGLEAIEQEDAVRMHRH